MTDTLIARLRQGAFEYYLIEYREVMTQAADRIEALQSRLTALEGQEPVATIKENPFTPEGMSDDIGVYLPNGTKLYLAAGAAPKEPKHKYELELPDGDTRKAKVWWTERETNDGALIHKLSISVDETPSTIQAAPTKEQT